MIETLLERRGHVFLPEDLTYSLIPDLYATDGVPLPDKTVWLKYFCGSATWYLMELDKDSLLAFGWADLGDPQNAELGYFSLTEMEALLVDTGWANRPSVLVERDCYWEQCKFGDMKSR